MTRGVPGPRPRIGLVDYGAGNLVSIGQALETVGADVLLVERASQIPGVAAFVVPGVGASAPAMRRLRRHGLDVALERAVAGGRWYLGVCLGMELLYERSEEDGATCLGWLAGSVVEIPDAPRLPHIGWNTVDVAQPHPLLSGLGGNSPAYFVHGYACDPGNPETVFAETEFGSRFPSVVAHERVLGVQFHPERSGADGLRLLRNFVELVARSC